MRAKYIVLPAAVIMFAVMLAGYLYYNGVIWFVNPANYGYAVKGIDVSRYQGDIDWRKVSAAGIKFAFIKATEGSSYSDPRFGANIASSKENCIFAGAYHFFSAESAGKAQAENFIKTVSPYELDLPPVVDFEIPKTEKDVESVIGNLSAFLGSAEDYFGVKPMIYATHESYNAFLSNNFAGYPVWIRDLFGKPEIAGNNAWIFWQYCNRGRISGVDNFVDLNVFNGTESEFERYVRAYR